MAQLCRLLIVVFVAGTYLASGCRGWLLAQAGLNETYRVKHLCTHETRVFLSIAVPSCTFPTLVEANWPGTSYLPMRTEVFPHRGAHANGDHGDCSRLHQAIWSEVDSLSRLWVMDLGWRDAAIYCPPKLLVFDLIKHNIEVLRINCGRFIEPVESKLLLVKLSPPVAPCRVEKFVYFVLDDQPHLLAYDILEQHWHRPQLLGRKYASVADVLPIVPVDIAYGSNNELLVSDVDGSLYISRSGIPHRHAPTSNLVQPAPQPDSATTVHDYDIHMELLGSLLGRSKGMMVDALGAGLFYVVPKFGAVVRVAKLANITAELNEIVYMTPKNIEQIFFGATGSVWILTERTLRPQDNCFSGE